MLDIVELVLPSARDVELFCTHGFYRNDIESRVLVGRFEAFKLHYSSSMTLPVRTGRRLQRQEGYRHYWQPHPPVKFPMIAVQKTLVSISFLYSSENGSDSNSEGAKVYGETSEMKERALIVIMMYKGTH